jgi:hypothetical protein
MALGNRPTFIGFPAEFVATRIGMTRPPPKGGLRNRALTSDRAGEVEGVGSALEDRVGVAQVGVEVVGRALGGCRPAGPGRERRPGSFWDRPGVFTGNRELTGLLPAVDLLGVDTGAAALRAGLKLLFEPLAPD